MLTQTMAVTGINLKSIPERWALSAVIVIGLAGVVAVFTALLAMAIGFEKTLTATGRTDAAFILRGGSQSELNSGISRDEATIIKLAPGIRKGADGQPNASAEANVIAELVRQGDKNSGANITVRGVEAKAFELRPNLKIVDGRKFTLGLRELIVGKGVIRQFQGANVGDTVRMRGSDWKVVGVFESGDAHDSEFWADFEVVGTTFQRRGYSSVTAELDGPDALKTLSDALKADPRLSVDVQTEQEYYSGQTKQFRATISGMAGFVTVIMALGAIFAALNTMYAAVATRAREIATLRAIGFGGVPVVLSVLIEALVLALIGGLLGALIAYLLFNNISVSTLGQNFTQVVFSFKVTPELMLRGLLIATFVGLLGGIFPATHPSGPFMHRVVITDAALIVVFSLAGGALGAMSKGYLWGLLVMLGCFVTLSVLAAIGYALTALMLRLRRRGALNGFWIKLFISFLILPVVVWLGFGFFGWMALYALWASNSDLDSDPMLSSLRTA